MDKVSTYKKLIIVIIIIIIIIIITITIIIIINKIISLSSNRM